MKKKLNVSLARIAFVLTATSFMTLVMIFLVGCDSSGSSEVIVPGSEVKIKPGDKLFSIEGHWRGEILNVNTEPIMVEGKELEWSFSRVYARNDKWPKRYSWAKPGAPERSFPWFTVVLPNDSRLYGQTLHATIQFKV